jgi:DNA-binding PucR family transcriptional regulator
VASELADQLGGAVTILDRSGVLLARGGSHEGADGESDPRVLDELVERARSTGRAVTAAGEDGHRRSAATVRAGDSVLGTLVWSHDDEPGAVDVRSLELATHVVGLILKENAAADAAERLSGELLTELIVASADVSATQRARARSRGIDLDALDVVVAVEAETASAGDLARHLHTVAREEGGLAGEHLGRATLVAPAEDAERFARVVHRRLRGELAQPVTVICDRVRGRDWARAFSRASRCLAIVRHIGTTDVGTTTQDLALYALVFDVERSADLDRFLDEAIGPLVAYDARRSTDLVTTLEAYFANDGNLRRTARALHVHLNTLLKRLDRVSTVLGQDWRAVDDLHLRLAIRLQSLRRELGT